MKKMADTIAKLKAGIRIHYDTTADPSGPRSTFPRLNGDDSDAEKIRGWLQKEVADRNLPSQDASKVAVELMERMRLKSRLQRNEQAQSRQSLNSVQTLRELAESERILRFFDYPNTQPPADLGILKRTLARLLARALNWFIKPSIQLGYYNTSAIRALHREVQEMRAELKTLRSEVQRLPGQPIC